MEATRSREYCHDWLVHHTACYEDRTVRLTGCFYIAGKGEL